MALKFISPDTPVIVDSLVMLVYAIPSAGKTTLALGAYNPFLINFEGPKGYARAVGEAPRVDVSTWREVEAIKTSDFPPGPGTIIVDTLGQAMESLTNHLIHSSRKNGTESEGLNQNGYGALKSTFVTWVKKIVAINKDVILLAHALEARQADGSIILRPDMVGRSSHQIYKFVDVMGYLSIGEDDSRLLSCSPTPISYGKNPAGWGSLPVKSPPGDYVARLIQAGKDAMSREGIKSVSQREEESPRAEPVPEPAPEPTPEPAAPEAPTVPAPEETVDPFAEAPEENPLPETEMSDLDRLNERLGPLLSDPQATNAQKTALWKEAQNLGYRFNQTIKSFVE